MRVPATRRLDLACPRATLAAREKAGDRPASIRCGAPRLRAQSGRAHVPIFSAATHVQTAISFAMH
jgi:hypothetical protein